MFRGIHVRSLWETGFRAVMWMCLAVFGSACVAVTPPSPASAQSQMQQRPRSVVALMCDGERRLCQGIVQALAETASGSVYRINPSPVPPRAFVLNLVIDSSGAARLWWADGAGAAVLQNEHSTAEFSRLIVDAAGPGLSRSLQKLP